MRGDKRYSRMIYPLSVSRRFAVGLVAVVFAVVLGGAAWAATNTYSGVESEAGTVTSAASQVADSSASGGQAVKFGMAAGGCAVATPFTPDGPDPWGGCWPGPQSTGVPAGETLTVVNGNQTYDSSYNGQTISNREFRGFVTVTGSNITFVNCLFRGGTASGNSRLLYATGGATNITVMDSDFEPMNPAPTIDGSRALNTTFLRVDIRGTTDGIKTGNNVTIRDSYIHDMLWWASDPNQGGGQTHNDGIQILSGVGVDIIHNTIRPAGEHGSNAAVQITQDQGAVDDILIEKNHVDWGGCTLNIANKPLATLTGVSTLDNHFGRNQRYANCAMLLASGVTLAGYSGNVWGDNGQPIPDPR